MIAYFGKPKREDSVMQLPFFLCPYRLVKAWLREDIDLSDEYLLRTSCLIRCDCTPYTASRAKRPLQIGILSVAMLWASHVIGNA